MLTTLLIVTSVIMLLIHIVGSIISFKDKSFPKKIGNFIALYEMIFYFMIIFNVSGILLLVGYFYLLIHVLGGIYYIKGRLSKLYISKGLFYYGIYEGIEALYIATVLITLII